MRQGCPRDLGVSMACPVAHEAVSRPSRDPCPQSSLRRILLVALLLAIPARLFAHPMGNFSISHYGGITIQRGFVEIRYLLDMAEIPTFQELQQTGLTARTDDPKLSSYLAEKSGALARGLKVSINGVPLALKLTSQTAIFPPGAGNLPTMKIAFVYRAEMPESCPEKVCWLGYEDTNLPGRAGWKEIVAQPAGGIHFATSTAPATDRSTQLSNYPTDLLNSPPQDLTARIAFTFEEDPNAVAVPRIPPSAPVLPSAYTGQAQNSSATAATRPNAPPSAGAGPRSQIEIKPNQQATPRNAFTELISAKQISFSVAWLAALVAIGLGALHALEPGHGKTIVAAYLVGAKGTARHAVLLGSIVTIAHTAGVYFLGAVTLYAQKYIVPDQLYPFLGVASGLIITGMGLYLFLQRYAGKLAHSHSHSHAHSHGPFGHTPPHDHSHEQPLTHSHSALSAETHTHSHLQPDQKPSITQLLVLGITGGIVPCPAALVVLLSAVALHRVGFGLFLIVAFSLGLAAVLIAMGLAAVCARRLMSRVPIEGPLIQRWLPLTSAAMITVLGCLIAVRGLIAAGIVQIRL